LIENDFWNFKFRDWFDFLRIIVNWKDWCSYIAIRRISQAKFVDLLSPLLSPAVCHSVIPLRRYVRQLEDGSKKKNGDAYEMRVRQCDSCIFIHFFIRIKASEINSYIHICLSNVILFLMKIFWENYYSKRK